MALGSAGAGPAGTAVAAGSTVTEVTTEAAGAAASATGATAGVDALGPSGSWGRLKKAAVPLAVGGGDGAGVGGTRRLVDCSARSAGPFRLKYILVLRATSSIQSGGYPSSSQMRCSWLNCDRPGKSGRPWKSSTAMQPSDHMSIAGSNLWTQVGDVTGGNGDANAGTEHCTYGRPRRTSGER